LFQNSLCTESLCASWNLLSLFAVSDDTLLKERKSSRWRGRWWWHLYRENYICRFATLVTNKLGCLRICSLHNNNAMYINSSSLESDNKIYRQDPLHSTPPHPTTLVEEAAMTSNSLDSGGYKQKQPSIPAASMWGPNKWVCMTHSTPNHMNGRGEQFRTLKSGEK
jgi:hypothetical protein